MTVAHAGADYEDGKWTFCVVVGRRARIYYDRLPLWFRALAWLRLAIVYVETAQKEASDEAR